MNPERMAKILKRVESRKRRALEREQRRLRRAGLQPTNNSKTQTNLQTNRVLPPEIQKARQTAQSKGGCGGCRKKAEQFRAKQAALQAEQKASQQTHTNNPSIQVTAERVKELPIYNPQQLMSKVQPQRSLPNLKNMMQKPSLRNM